MAAILEIRDRPPLRRPVMLAGFNGWGNAGGAAMGSIEYLLNQATPRPDPCAVADPDACFDFTVARPTTRRGEPDGWILTLPSLACYAVPRPEAERDLLLVMGPEPSFRWTSLASELASFAAGLDVQLVLTLGGFVGPVSHRSGSVVRRTLHAPLDVALAELGVTDTAYEGPTAFQTAVLHGAHEQHLPAASLWVAAAPYVQGPNPRATLALLETVNRLAELGLNLDRLRAQVTDWMRQLDDTLDSNPTLKAQLSRMIDLGEDAPLAADSPRERSPEEGELPSGSALVEELEKFLRQMQQPPEGESS